MTPDATLLRQAQAGDITAFEALVRRHFGLVFTIALARLRDREIAEDLAQEVMLRAFLHLKSLRADSTFPAWVARIARNLAIDWRRRGQRASRLLPQVPLDQEKLETLRAEEKGAREAMATHQESEALREALFNLPENLRELVLLHHSEGLSQSELAERLGTTQATISRRLKAAREALRDQLEPLIREVVPALRPSQSAIAKSVAFIAGAAALTASAKAGLAASAQVGSLAEASVGAAGMAGSLPALLAGGIKAMATGKGMMAAAAAAVAVGGGIYLNVQTGPETEASTREITASMLPHPGVFAVGGDGNLVELAPVPTEEDRRLEEMGNAMETDEDAAAVMGEVGRLADRINAPIIPPDARLLFFQPERLAEMQAGALPDVDQVRFDADMASLQAISSVQQEMHLSDRVLGLMEIQPTEPFSADIVAVSWNEPDGRTSWLGRVGRPASDGMRVFSVDSEGRETEWAFNDAARGMELQAQFERGEATMDDVIAAIRAPEVQRPVSLRLENHPENPGDAVFLFQSDSDQSGGPVAVTWSSSGSTDTWSGRIDDEISREFLSLPATVSGSAGTFAARVETPEGAHRAFLIQPDGSQIPLPAMSEREMEPLLEDIPGAIQSGRIPVMQPGVMLLFQGEDLTEAHFTTGPGGLSDAIRFGAISLTEGREWNVTPLVSPRPDNAWEVRLPGPLGDFVMIARDGGTPDEDIGHIVAIAGSPLVP